MPKLTKLDGAMLNVNTHNAVSFCTNYSSLVAAPIQGR